MQDTDYMENVYESTDSSGFRVLTWYNAGTRNFYGKKAINTPEDLSGMKIRVQQSPASVAMMQAFGAAASPMSFGEVYTAIQQGLDEDELKVVKEAALKSTVVERTEVDKCVEEAKNTAHNEMGVEFIYPDITLFKDKVKNMQQNMIQKNPSIVDIYNHIQEVNKRIGEEK